MTLDSDAAQRAMAPLAAELDITIETLAEGVLSLANEHMSQALRVISIQQGYDPREFSLMCFGGAGGLHVCDLAETLEIPEAIVPANSGILSALGMVTSKPGRELVQTFRNLLAHIDPLQLEQYVQSLTEQARSELAAEGVTEIQCTASLDLRYLGQSHTLNIRYDSVPNAIDSFNREHQKQYGHRTDIEIELLNVRLSAIALKEPGDLPSLPPTSEPSKKYGGRVYPKTADELKTVNRSKLNAKDYLEGPILVIEDHATTYVKGGWAGVVDKQGNIRLTRL